MMTEDMQDKTNMDTKILSPNEANPFSDRVGCQLHVCTSCRPSGHPRDPEDKRPGFKLYEELRRLIDERKLNDQVNLVPTECLSLCSRSCGIALSAEGSWSYLFGDQKPDQTAQDILDCAETYIRTPRGAIARAARPATLRSSILGRIPPSDS